MSNSHECVRVNGEALQLHAVIKSHFVTASHTRICISTTSHVKICIRYCKSRENLYAGTASHTHWSEHGMKSKVRMIKLLSP